MKNSSSGQIADMTKVQQVPQAIKALKDVKELLEKLDYGWTMTDSLEEIIEALEHDLGELLFEEEDSE